MTIKSSFGAVNLDVNAGADDAPAAEFGPETPFRILLLGDFSGRADRPATSSPRWKPVEVDRDNIDEVIARLKPGFAGLLFRDMDGFHPDRIYEENELFQPMREVRRKLEEASTFDEAAAEIRAWTAGQVPPAAVVAEAPPRAPLSVPPGGSLLDSILDAAEPRSTPAPVRRDELQSFVESVVAPHQVPAENTELPRLRELLDAECSARMRIILHHPAFQAIEAAWRAVFQLVRAIETGDLLKVYLLDISKSELETDLTSAEDLRDSRIWRTLVDEASGEAGEPWSAVAGNYSFRRTVGDVQMLGRLARIMRVAGAPFLAEADPGNSKADSEEGVQQWESLRASPDASWIGLTLPRFLLRMPYGKRSAGVESFDFEEFSGAPDHQQYLWGNPAFACVQLLAQGFANDEQCSEIHGLPLHVYEDQGEKQVKPCAEVLLTERDVDWILDQGYMALVSLRGRDVVRLVRFQSIKKPLTRLSGRWLH